MCDLLRHVLSHIRPNATTGTVRRRPPEAGQLDRAQGQLAGARRQ